MADQFTIVVFKNCGKEKAFEYLTNSILCKTVTDKDPILISIGEMHEKFDIITATPMIRGTYNDLTRLYTGLGRILNEQFERLNQESYDAMMAEEKEKKKQETSKDLPKQNTQEPEEK